MKKNVRIKYAKLKILYKINLKKKRDAFVKIGNKFYQNNSKGIDIIEFFISTNPGEDVKPLSLWLQVARFLGLC